MQESFACVGYGPQLPGRFFNYTQIGGAQKAQSDIDFAPGVWAPTPSKGILFWNPHAFNLTDQDTTMHGWLNYSYAQDRRYISVAITDKGKKLMARVFPVHLARIVELMGRLTASEQEQLAALCRKLGNQE